VTDSTNPVPAGAVGAVISRLFVYPVKSCAGVEVKQAILTETGLEFDRAWMVVDENGHFLTQRELPRMALIQPQLKHFDMVLRAPGMLALHVSLNEVEEPVQVKVWSDQVKAYDMGAIAAQWFSDFLGRPARLVRFDPEQKRLANMDWTGGLEATSQFADGYPILLVSEASLAGLNEKLTGAGSAPVDMRRFRPNVVIGDAPGFEALAPHDEDRLEDLQVATAQGLVQLRPVKPCPRCPIPNIDQSTAVSSPEVNDMLQTYRQDPRVGGALTFGMNLIMLNPADQVLEVGQAVGADWRFD
jgi:uncharacterized protein YcbX